MRIPSAEEALVKLEEGNRRFNSAVSLKSDRLGSSHEKLLDGQWPFAIILSCSDSRVPPEIVFDTRLGDLFVVRVAGNIANRASIASIEFAVSMLGTHLVVVMGHESCGAVTAAINGHDAGTHIDYLLSHIEPAIQGSNDVTTVAKRHARLAADRLVEQSPILRRAAEAGDLKIVTAFLHFKTLLVEFD
jgi:carbonic anhydrase